MVFGWRALRPLRVVFVLGFVSLINSLTSQAKKWRDRCVRVSDGVGGAWAEGGLEGNSEQALGKVGQLEVWGAGGLRGVGACASGGEAEGREMRFRIDVLQLSRLSPFSFSLF